MRELLKLLLLTTIITAALLLCFGFGWLNENWPSIATAVATAYIAVFTEKLAKYNQQLLKENREILKKLETLYLFVMRQGNTFKVINLSKSSISVNAVFACPIGTTLNDIVNFIKSSMSVDPYSTNSSTIPTEFIPIEPLRYQNFDFVNNPKKFFLMEKRESQLIPKQNVSGQRIPENVRFFVLFYYPGGFGKIYIYETLLTGRIPKKSELHSIEL